MLIDVWSVSEWRQEWWMGRNSIVSGVVGGLGRLLKGRERERQWERERDYEWSGVNWTVYHQIELGIQVGMREITESMDQSSCWQHAWTLFWWNERYGIVDEIRESSVVASFRITSNPSVSCTARFTVQGKCLLSVWYHRSEMWHMLREHSSDCGTNNNCYWFQNWPVWTWCEADSVCPSFLFTKADLIWMAGMEAVPNCKLLLSSHLTIYYHYYTFMSHPIWAVNALNLTNFWFYP